MLGIAPVVVEMTPTWLENPQVAAIMIRDPPPCLMSSSRLNATAVRNAVASIRSRNTRRRLARALASFGGKRLKIGVGIKIAHPPHNALGISRQDQGQVENLKTSLKNRLFIILSYYLIFCLDSRCRLALSSAPLDNRLSSFLLLTLKTDSMGGSLPAHLWSLLSFVLPRRKAANAAHSAVTECGRSGPESQMGRVDSGASH